MGISRTGTEINPYSVIQSIGSTYRVVSEHTSSGEAISAMNRLEGVVAVRNTQGRILASNVRRSFG